MTALPEKLEANDASDLGAQLENMRVEVAPELRNRTNASVEWYTLRYGLLRALQRVPHGHCRIEKRESPDFLLRACHQTIGIEITELRGPSAGRAQARAQAQKLDVYFIGKTALTDAKPTSKALEHELRHGGPAFTHDEIERIAKDRIIERIAAKTATTSSRLWTLCDQKWLFIYDNLSFAGCKMERVADWVAQSLPPTPFDMILLVTEEKNIIITAPNV